MKLNKQFFVITAFIIIASLSRLVPHLPNFTAISAIALFGAAYYDKKITALLVPITILFITDAILGFYQGMAWIYGTFIIVALIGFMLRKNTSVPRVIFASILSSICFYLLTDFGTWIGTNMYPHTFNGLIECYIAAIPFSRYEAIGTLFYSGVLFGSYYFAQRRFPVLAKSKIQG